MDEHRTNPIATWGTFLTPVLVGIGTCMPVYITFRGTPAFQMSMTIDAAIPFVLIMIALVIAVVNNRALLGWRLFFLTVFSCAISPIHMVWLMYSELASLFIYTPMVLVFTSCGADLLGPLVFVTGVGLLWRHERSTRPPSNACASCSYDLTGLKDGAVCPECGTAVESDGSGDGAVCPECGLSKGEG